MKNKHYALLFFFVSNLAFGQSSQYINVRIAKNLKNTRVSGIDMKSKLHLINQNKSYSGRKSLSFKCDGLLKKIKGDKNLLLATIDSMTETLTWNKQKYRGSLKIVWPKNAKGCELINQLPLETYISTLLSKEMNAKWPIEALKAQAVAARTYAFHKIKSKQVSKSAGYETFYDLENSEKHQVNGSLSDETVSTSKAAKETRGQVLTLPGGNLTPIFFHSKCGGKTLRPGDVWTNNVKGYQSVNCPFCHKHGKKAWSLKFTSNNLKNYLTEALSKYEKVFVKKPKSASFTMVPDNKSRKEIRFYLNDRHMSISKSRLRAVLGRKKLPSNNFQLWANDNNITVKGTGYGHGVGLCQFGAFELAKRGYTYKQILSHYFPDHKLERIY